MGRRHRIHQYTFEEKKLALETFFSESYAEISLKEFSNICGINYYTMRDWVRVIGWDVSRIEELRRKSRKRPTESLTQLPGPVQALILQLKDRFPAWGPLKIKQYLFRHEQVLIPQTSIYRYLKSKGLVKEREKTPGEEKHDRRFEYPYPLAAVQMDLMELTLSSGTRIYLVSLLDDYSRFVLGNRFTAVKTMDETIGALTEAVRTYGVMERLLTDHGGEFVSWQRFTRFEELLSNLEVEYIASGPNKKQNQGKVERWHQTIREALREHGPLDFSSQAQLWIRGVSDIYNYERPHQALGGLVPADRFFGVSEELEAEMQSYRKEERLGQRIYFTCRVGDQKIVVSGPRADKLAVMMNGVRVEDKAQCDQLEKLAAKESVGNVNDAAALDGLSGQLEEKTIEQQALTEQQEKTQ